MPRPEELRGDEKEALLLPTWITDTRVLAIFLYTHVRPQLAHNDPTRLNVLDFGPGPRGHIEAIAARLGLGRCKITFLDRGDFNSGIEVTEVALQGIQDSDSLSRRSRLSQRELKITYVKGELYNAATAGTVPPQDIVMAFNIHPSLTAPGEPGVEKLVELLKPNGILVITTANKAEFAFASSQAKALAGQGKVSIIENRLIIPPIKNAHTELKETHVTMVRRA